jgi:hypothetical protein
VFFRKDSNTVTPFAGWPETHESDPGCGEFRLSDEARQRGESDDAAQVEPPTCDSCGKVNAGQLVDGDDRCSCKDAEAWLAETGKALARAVKLADPDAMIPYRLPDRVEFLIDKLLSLLDQNNVERALSTQAGSENARLSKLCDERADLLHSATWALSCGDGSAGCDECMAFAAFNERDGLCRFCGHCEHVETDSG